MTLKDLIEIIDKRPSWTNAALKSEILSFIAKDIEIRTDTKNNSQKRDMK